MINVLEVIVLSLEMKRLQEFEGERENNSDESFD